MEVDRGTESHRQLRDKLDHYATRQVSGEKFGIVLFVFLTAQREKHVRPLLAHSALVSAASTTLEQYSLTEPVWATPPHTDKMKLTELFGAGGYV